MSASRLSLAVNAGILDINAGRILAFRPPGDISLSPLRRESTLVVHGLRSAYDHFAGAGWDVSTEPEGEFDSAVIFLPREKLRARAMIAEAAARTHGPIVIDGNKTDGIESVLRDVRGRATVGEVISKGHGKIFAAEGAAYEDWRTAAVTVEGFRIAPGLFSSDGPDRGSVALAAVLPNLSGAVADLGAGWGFLSARVLASPDVVQLHAVEAEHEAVACLSANVDDPRTSIHWADAARWRPPRPLDTVVTNPPFHLGHRPDPSIGQAFITAASTMLGARGSLWMVANRHLPYEDVLSHSFREIREIEGDSRFKLIHARSPNSPMR
jgi:16S rRNA (guanine1207-N2)-methyltransferase